MKVHPECYPCFINQAYNTLKLITQDHELQFRIIREIMRGLVDYEGDDPPPKVSRIVYGTISQVTGVKDPYQEKKRECNRMALELYPRLKEMVKEAPAPLFMAVKIAIMGNIIDFGAGRFFEMKDLDMQDELDLAINNYNEFHQDLEKANTVLYLGDNAGEVVFDKVLIEEIRGKDVVFAVRAGPVINDVTFEDAKEAEIDKVARVISSGSFAPGILLDEATDEFRNLFFKADMVISKGQGNFETLEDVRREVYFLFRAKCEVIAQLLNVPIGSILLVKGGSARR